LYLNECLLFLFRYRLSPETFGYDLVGSFKFRYTYVLSYIRYEEYRLL